MPKPSEQLARNPSKESIETFVRLLDDAIRLPGTRIGVGLDALLGLLLPAFGDLVTGLTSFALLVVAWRRRVPAPTMVRMVVNILIDTVVGAIPVAGDFFDLAWRSNRMNLALIERHARTPETPPTASDYLVAALAFTVAAAAIVIPFVLLVLYAGFLLRFLAGR